MTEEELRQLIASNAKAIEALTANIAEGKKKEMLTEISDLKFNPGALKANNNILDAKINALDAKINAKVDGLEKRVAELEFIIRFIFIICIVLIVLGVYSKLFGWLPNL